MLYNPTYPELKVSITELQKGFYNGLGLPEPLQKLLFHCFISAHHMSSLLVPSALEANTANAHSSFLFRFRDGKRHWQQKRELLRVCKKIAVHMSYILGIDRDGLRAFRFCLGPTNEACPSKSLIRTLFLNKETRPYEAQITRQASLKH